MDETYPTPGNQNASKKLVYISLFLVVIVMFLATITYIISNFSAKTGSKADNRSISPGQPTNPSSVTRAPVNPALKTPEVKFVSYVEPQITPEPHVNGKSYAFKQDYTKSEIDQIAKKLGTEKEIPSENTVVHTYYSNSTSGVSALDFNQQTGSFSYVNTKGIPLSESQQTEDK
ncbi:MAG: hypothetical protein ABIO02_01525, partial [Patescibacteria group bacterium]